MKEQVNINDKFIVKEDGSVTATVYQPDIELESQLDRIEKKVDRILNILEDKDRSTSVELDSVQIGKVTDEMIEKYNLERFGYSKKSTPGSISL